MSKPRAKYRDILTENGVTVSETDIFALMREIGDKVDSEILQKALIAGGMLLRDYTRQRLVKKMPIASKAVGRERNITMEQGIQAANAMYNNRAAANVYVLGNYLNRWFESGTDDRKLRRNHKKDKKHHKTYKKGESRGKITGLRFFSDAVRSDMGKVCERIMSVVRRELNKIFDN